ncbi:hypothetical protein [Rhodococcus oryzae]|uniref:hypothetical protein n=1 Tax=Rhodococcus oryzae TaxID=2571143 RepID=UPI0037B03A1C
MARPFERGGLNAAKHTGRTSSLAKQRKAGDLPFGYYAQAWIERQQVKVAQGRLKQRTLDDYDRTLRRYALDRFGGKAIANITPRDCEKFLTALVGQKPTPMATGSPRRKVARVTTSPSRRRRQLRHPPQNPSTPTSSSYSRSDPFGTTVAVSVSASTLCWCRYSRRCPKLADSATQQLMS